MAHEEFPEADRAGDAPHPRETAHLFGQELAEANFLEAYATGRLHHGWLITGPKGIGKATLAWRIARFLIAEPVEDASASLFGAPSMPSSLDVSAEHSVSRRLRALSDPGLFLLRRPWDEKSGRHKTQISVEEVRRLHGFFALSSADGGRRVVIVDAADEMNIQAANALLKMLEEPPARTTLLLIAHQPARLLPTIRSRCREMRLSPLTANSMAAALAQAGAVADEGTAAALAELSAGSVGEALRLLELDGLKFYGALVAYAARLPNMDRASALALAEMASGGRGSEARTDLVFQLTQSLIARAARFGAMAQAPSVELVPGEARVLAQLAQTPQKARAWADAAQRISARVSHGRAVNVDSAQLMLDALLTMQATAAA